MSEVPTVWILGAGFSRSLGGPLLDDLLSMRGWYEYLEDEHKAASATPLRQALTLYHFGRGFPEGYLFDTRDEIPRGTNWWGTAEEFLEQLSGLVADPTTAERRWQTLKQGFGGSAQHVRTYLSGRFEIGDVFAAAVRLVAWQCRFVERHKGTIDDWERASPYRDWGKLLNENDTLITFNYDTVVEGLAREDIDVVLPSEIAPQSPSPEPPNAAHHAPTKPRLLKLHGSVDWTDQNGTVIRLPRTAKPLIATPGDAKYSYRRGMFSPLWDAASKAIKAAQQIVWMGYSMPASDASAVNLLLSSIGDNATDGLEIDIVLGNGAADARRIQAMLTGVLTQRPNAFLKQRTTSAQQHLHAIRLKSVELRKAHAERQRAAQRQQESWLGQKTDQLRTLVTEIWLERSVERTLNDAFGQDFDRHVTRLPPPSPGYRLGTGDLYAQDYLRAFAVARRQDSAQRADQATHAAIVAELEAFKAEVLK